MTKKNMAHGLPKIFQQETLEIFKHTKYMLHNYFPIWNIYFL